MLQLDEPKMEVAAVVGKLTRALPKWPFHTYLSWIFVSWKRQNTLQSANHKHFCWASSYDKTAIFFIRYYFSYFINSREAAKAVFRIHSFGVINCVSAINKGRERWRRGGCPGIIGSYRKWLFPQTGIA